MSERDLDLQFRREVIRKTTPVHAVDRKSVEWSQQNERPGTWPGL